MSRKALSPPPPEPTVVWDAQGTPRSPRFGDIYRSQGLDGLGGLAQSRHVFLQGCGLLGPQARWQHRAHWTVLETGFGLGLNFLTTWAAWRADPHRSRLLHFMSVEAFPVTAQDVLRSAAPWPELRPLAQSLAERWWGLIEGVHRLRLDDGQVLLTLGIGPAAQRLHELSGQADSVFLDGFSPDVNPELWSPSLLSQVAEHCRPGTQLSTWCVTRPVREALQHPGCGHRSRLVVPSSVLGWQARRWLTPWRSEAGRWRCLRLGPVRVPAPPACQRGCVHPMCLKTIPGCLD